ncbi:STM3941 family protein [Flavobacterium limi]|uniref:YcxB-like protein n=1 Tax=Flavobacterium limi TaxID=2045105 RepID=A0ABQ1TKQ4_9FLAO|nr:STM3941 family protein [Flavobacterium limi]GGE97470.1 hypothetical protein GCM10011518_03520 [Flavobacterium limi]
MDNLLYPYYSIKLWLDSVIFLIIAFSLILLTLFNSNQPFGIILAFFLIILTKYPIQKTIKNLYRSLKNQPAIELTEAYFFDHINNIKIYWHNIDKLSVISIRGNTYVNFILKDNNEYAKQLNGFLPKILFKLPDPEEIATKTEISLVKGRKEDIYNSICKFREAKKL